MCLSLGPSLYQYRYWVTDVKSSLKSSILFSRTGQNETYIMIKDFCEWGTSTADFKAVLLPVPLKASGFTHLQSVTVV